MKYWMRSMHALVSYVSMFTAVLQAQNSVSHSSKIAEGVYVIRHEEAPDGYVEGNTTVIIGDKSVLVVDAPFWPATARNDIKLIRGWTSKPLRYLLNTHWHHDHCLANGAYIEAFPEMEIIAHQETKKEMDLLIPTYWNRLINRVQQLNASLAEGIGDSGRPLMQRERESIQKEARDRKVIYDQLQSIEYKSPNITFEHELELDLGNKLVKVMHLGKGNTAGDAVVLLPQDRILITGDLIVHPFPYFYDGYPSEWMVTLQKILRLDFETLVPGHGQVQKDPKYVKSVLKMLRSAVDQLAERLKKVGAAEFATFDDVKEHIDLSGFAVEFGVRDAKTMEEFNESTSKLIHLVFKEASLR